LGVRRCNLSQPYPSTTQEKQAEARLAASLEAEEAGAPQQPLKACPDTNLTYAADWECNVTSGTGWRVTDVTFRFARFVVIIRLIVGTKSGAEMERRKERRLELDLPVRIWGVDRMAQPFAELVRVRNVSNHGAVLIGVRSKVQTGEVLEVQHGASRVQFRIVWMSSSGEAVIQALAFEPPILGIGLPKVFGMVGTG
jgi:hypothetical protein